jgi:hypothetical protein
MKPRFYRNSFLALALVSLSSLALGQMAPAPAAQTGKKDGAKDLFYQQLEKPQLAMNTGLQYWIELHRKGQVLKVSNKTEFYSGDKIRFHIRPNIDGYSYVLLKCGSRGNRDVLFPLEKYKDDNRIARGRDIAIPTQPNDLLEFDNDPGVENVGIVLSRKPIDANQYLNKTQPVVIASGISGSKDLVPSRVMVQPAATQEAQSTSPQITNVVATAVPSTTGLVTEEDGPSKVSPTPKVDNNSSSSSSSPSSGSGSSSSNANAAPENKQEHGVTTVVQQDAGILSIDVMLQHL